MELTPTKVHIKTDKSSYSVARGTRPLFNSSLHYPLFLREVKKPNLLSRNHSLGHIHYKLKHWHEVPVKGIYRNLKTPPTKAEDLQLTPFTDPRLTTQVHQLGMKAAVAGK